MVIVHFVVLFEIFPQYIIDKAIPAHALSPKVNPS